MSSTTSIEAVRNIKSGDVYVALIDSGHITAAVGPLHYSEIDAALDDPEWNEDGLEEDLDALWRVGELVIAR